MTNPTPRQEMAWLGTLIKRGRATPADRERFQVLLQREIAPAVQRAILEQLPATRRRKLAQIQSRNRRW